MKEKTIVYETTDYSKFSYLEGNRAINLKHLKGLSSSLQKRHLVAPIIVNKDFKIIDGQHRFQACKSLFLPIYFIIQDDYGLEEVHILNANNKVYSKVDYLNGYCDQKLPEYLKFREFMLQFPEFGIASCESLLINRRHKVCNTDKKIASSTNPKGFYLKRDFQEGKLKIHDYQLAVNRAIQLRSLRIIYKRYYRYPFVVAIISISKIEGFSFDKLMTKLSQNPRALQDSSTSRLYRFQLDEIYNFKSRITLDLRCR